MHAINGVFSLISAHVIEDSFSTPLALQYRCLKSSSKLIEES